MKIIKAHPVTKIPENEQHNYDGVVAFQFVDFEITFFGKIQRFTLDTKILQNGDQFVIDGNGWIKSGTKIN